MLTKDHRQHNVTSHKPNSIGLYKPAAVSRSKGVNKTLESLLQLRGEEHFVLHLQSMQLSTLIKNAKQ